MFGIGFSELAVIAIVLLVMIRPEDLPAFFRKLGRLYAQAKKAYAEVASMKDDFLREMDVAAAVQEAAQSAAGADAGVPAQSPSSRDASNAPASGEGTAASPEGGAPAKPDGSQED